MQNISDQEGKEKIFDLIKDIRICQLVTHSQDSGLHARPMAAKVEVKDGKDWDGSLWYFTYDNSPKINELEKNPDVLLSYSDPHKQEYISIAGKAHVVRDKAKIKELWAEPMRTWFPKGPETDNIALIHVHSERAEYWDSPSSTIIYAYGYLKARLTGNPPNPGENKVVNLK